MAYHRWSVVSSPGWGERNTIVNLNNIVDPFFLATASGPSTAVVTTTTSSSRTTTTSSSRTTTTSSSRTTTVVRSESIIAFGVTPSEIYSSYPYTLFYHTGTIYMLSYRYYNIIQVLLCTIYILSLH